MSLLSEANALMSGEIE